MRRMNLRDVPDDVYEARAQASSRSGAAGAGVVVSLAVVDASLLVAFYATDDSRRPIVADRLAAGDTLLARPIWQQPGALRVYDTEDMSVSVSVRLDERLVERLRRRSRAAGESLSECLRRYAEEGARRVEHPMITFRDGSTGRRAGLVAGPDVWEVAMWIDDLGEAGDPAELVADGIVTRLQIGAALAYRSAYRDEIQARIDLHRSETRAAEAR